MPTYNSLAVVGGGSIGLPILNALAAQNISVVLLSRPGASAKSVPSGVKTETVDTSDANAVAGVLKQYKVEVVISTTTTLAAASQTVLVDAAKQANVKLFVPAEFGMPTEGQTEGIQGAKNEVAGEINNATSCRR
jgi:saccharopine dehydrogenase-like NADP-dependent oxidoreductase